MRQAMLEGLIASDGDIFEVQQVLESNDGFRAKIRIEGVTGSVLQTYYTSNNKDFLSAVREMEDKAYKEFYKADPDLVFFEDPNPQMELPIEEPTKKATKKKTTKKKVAKVAKPVGVTYKRADSEHKSIVIGILCDLFGDSWISEKSKTELVKEFNGKITGKEMIFMEDGSVSESFKVLFKDEFTGLL